MFNRKLRYSVIFTIVMVTCSTNQASNSSIDIRPIFSGVSTDSMAISNINKCDHNPAYKGHIVSKPQETTALLQKIIDGKRATGVAVGWVTPELRCRFAVGSSGNAARPQIDGDTRFELGSITKAFTGTLLADRVAKGELKIDEPIGAYLPPSAQGNTALAAVSFRQLTTHTAGLGRVPFTTAFVKSGFSNPLDPYANYSQADFVSDLASMSAKPNAAYAYSNTGGALLGLLLANRAGQPYETLVQERLLTPLRMSATKLTPPSDTDPLDAQPHDTQLKPTPAWSLGAFVSTGGMRSNVNDMMKLIDANLQGKAPWRASHEQLAPRGNVGGVAYNWHIARLVANENGVEKRDTLVWHNGGTFGSTAFVGFDVERGIGVVVLVNTAALGLADEIGMHLWDQRNPAPAFTPKKNSLGGLGALLIAGIVFACFLLATRGYASACTSTEANAPAARPSFLRKLLFKPFIDRIDVLVTAVYTFASVSFIAKFVAAIPIGGSVSIHTLFNVCIALAFAYALWVARNLPWWKGGGLKRYASIALHAFLSAIFLWVAFA